MRPVLEAARAVADRYGVTLANVAVRWVLQRPSVAAAIVGARLGRSAHVAETLDVFKDGFVLDADDLARIDAARAGLTPLPGDCGDEYRRPPFLTASGDLSHHVASSATATIASASPDCSAGRSVSSCSRNTLSAFRPSTPISHLAWNGEAEQYAGMKIQSVAVQHGAFNRQKSSAES